MALTAVGALLAGCADDGGTAATGCEATRCRAEVAAWEEQVASLPGVVDAADAGYAERRTLRREAAVHIDLTLSAEGYARADEIAEKVAEEAWKSEIAPLGGVQVTYLLRGGRDEEQETETFSFLLHEEDYTDRWGPRPVR